MRKISELGTLELCLYLNDIGRNDHAQLIIGAEEALDAAFEVPGPVDMDIDWRPPLTHLRALEAEGRDILRAAMAERRGA
ncbi:hypothetical protein Q0M94_28485 (plasmid) [Deinococcus radiomollis]|uniref:hypothetical protein n=1 Tax=Deinococcus radiomollis TaxID=468916 RepID=UPI003892A10F